MLLEIYWLTASPGKHLFLDSSLIEPRGEPFPYTSPNLPSVAIELPDAVRLVEKTEAKPTS